MYTDHNYTPPKPDPLPGADKVKTLLDQGQIEEAHQYAKAYTATWLKMAEEGHVMNLSDMMAVNEQLMETD